MSGGRHLARRIRGVFVEPAGEAVRIGWTAAARPPARIAAPAMPSGGPGAPAIVVLCAPSRARDAAAALALALADATGATCGVAAATDVAESGAATGLALPGARRTAARLRERGLDAAACGRLVWLGDRRVRAHALAAPTDPAAACAAASAELGRAALMVGAPAALAVPLARTPALDRVIAWHDAIVVVREPDAVAAVTGRVVESLAALGLPVACVQPPSRLDGALAQAGIRAPSFALEAVGQLGIPTPAGRA